MDWVIGQTGVKNLCIPIGFLTRLSDHLWPYLGTEPKFRLIGYTSRGVLLAGVGQQTLLVEPTKLRRCKFTFLLGRFCYDGRQRNFSYCQSNGANYP